MVFIVRASSEPIVTTKLCIEAQVIARMVSMTEGREYTQIEVVNADNDEVLGYFLKGEGFQIIEGSAEPDDVDEKILHAFAWDIREMTLAQWSRGYGEDKATLTEDGYAVIQELAARYGVEEYLPSEQDWDKGRH